MTGLTPQQRAALIRRRLEARLAQRARRGPALSQINLGIADTVGGAIDLINPFNRPHALNPFPEGTGSARQGLLNVMQAAGAAGEDRPPEGVGEAFLRGSGQAAGAAPLVAGSAAALSNAPGMVGQVAQTFGRGLSTTPAIAAETVAGGVSSAAMEGAEQAGAPEWLQQTAGIVAPMTALPAATYAAGRTGNALRNFSPAVQAARGVAGAVAPYTRRGAEALARNRMQELAGSRERALELGERINPDNEFGLTPAQQTGEPRMLALEQAARAGDAILDDRLERQFAESMGMARGAVDEIGGNVGDAQGFFREARARYTTELRSEAQQAVRNAEQRLQGISADRRPSENSAVVMREIEAAREAARTREGELWNSVPRAATVPTTNARATAESLLSDTPRAQRGDYPQVASDLLLGEGGLGEATTVNELHGLYSRLRQIAREASAGPAPNENRARMANQVAEAILEDLGARAGDDAVGRAINEARAFSRALHETFDMGAYGRLARQTVQGDTVTDPRVALDRSVGRGGTGGMTDAENLEAAAAGLAPSGAPGRPNEPARNAIADYIRGRFEGAAFVPDAQGQMVVNPRSAAQFVRNNQELLERYPELRQEVLDAGRQQQDATTLAQAIARRIEAVENARSNPVSGFADASQETAIRSIIDADNPIQAAQAVLSQARRDTSGAAIEGVKAALSDEIIRRASRTADGVQFLEADAMLERMQDGRFRAAMTRVMEADEIRRLEEIVRNVQLLNQSQTRQPALRGESLSGAQSPRVIQVIARIAGAQAATRTGAGSGNAGVSLQAANLGAGTANQVLNRLTADRASQILADAVTDPRLFQALLMDPSSPRFEREALPRLIPYLTGTAAQMVAPEDQAQRSPFMERIASVLSSRPAVRDNGSMSRIADAIMSRP